MQVEVVFQMFPMPLMNENAVYQQGKPHKFQAYPAADRTLHKHYQSERSPVADSQNTILHRFFHTHHTQAGITGQERPRSNDMSDTSNSSTLPHLMQEFDFLKIRL